MGKCEFNKDMQKLYIYSRCILSYHLFCLLRYFCQNIMLNFSLKLLIILDLSCGFCCSSIFRVGSVPEFLGRAVNLSVVFERNPKIRLCIRKIIRIWLLCNFSLSCDSPTLLKDGSPNYSWQPPELLKILAHADHGNSHTTEYLPCYEHTLYGVNIWWIYFSKILAVLYFFQLTISIVVLRQSLTVSLFSICSSFHLYLSDQPYH